MSNVPSQADLQQALSAAGPAHHEYEQHTLNGARDEHWATFYAAYTLGRLGDFAAPSALTRWLQDAPTGEEWAASAASHVLEQLSASHRPAP